MAWYLVKHRNNIFFTVSLLNLESITIALAYELHNWGFESQ